MTKTANGSDNKLLLVKGRMLYKFSANTQLEIELLSSRGKLEAVYPRLELSVKIGNPFDFALAFMTAAGEISTRTAAGSIVHLGVPYFVSTQTPFRETYISARHHAQALLVLDLDWRKLEHIEQERSGDLFLQGTIHALCACLEKGVPGTDPMIESLIWVSGEIRRGNQSPFPIYQTEWIKILEGWSYGKRRVLEVNLPSAVNVAQAVLNHLETAQKALWKGEYEGVLVWCRKALEEMDNILGDWKGALQLKLGSESKADIALGVRKSLKDLLNKGAHTGSPITRRDADFALLLTETLIGYVSSV